MRRVALATVIGVATWTLAAPPVVADPGDQDIGRFLAHTQEAPRARVLAEDAEAPKGWIVVGGDPAVDPEEEASRLSAQMGVEVVPDGVLELALDPLFDEQWYLRNNGQTGGTVGADVAAIQAWDVGDGAGSVVAIIDTGADLDHPDLNGRWWNNPDEIGGNGIDDDGNGLVDDDIGWDFVDSDPNPSDDHGHGTRVTGLVGARRDDIGMAGLASGADLMILRACTSGGCSISRVAAAIDYAVAHGADVINLSLGGNTAGLAPLGEAVDRAGTADVVLVAAAGNENSDLAGNPFYPASFPAEHVMAVGASDSNDRKAGFSNFGDEEVDLSAPGVDLLVTTIDGDWALDSGTSFAAPLAAAVAAMVRALRPDLDAVEAKELILGATDRLPALAGRTVTGGRLDAGAAMAVAASVRAEASAHPQLAVAPATVRFSGSGSTGPIVGATWTIDGSTTPGLTVEVTVDEPAVVAGTLIVEGVTGATDHASVEVLVGEDFVDTRTSVFEEDVIWLSANGLTDGCSETAFCPDRPVTRGEAAALIRRGLDIPAVLGASAFTDDDDSIFESDLAALATIGALRGCDPPTNASICPADPLTRAQMAAVLVRTLGLPPSGVDVFTDDDGSIFEPDIQALAQAGITRGCNPPADDRYCPTQPVTRGELAAFLHRAG